MNGDKKFIISTIIGVVVLVLVIGCFIFNSQGCQRTLESRIKIVDLKSNFGGELNRTINVYTADGQKLATYSGKIDIGESEGGYVKFDYDGKRYIYYNCFVESIGDIE